MPLPSFFKRKDKPKPKPKAERRAAPSPVDDSEPVQQARTRARRRLIGAVVLLAAGVIVFPLIFETQPRPIAVDTPIELAAKPAAQPLPARPAPPPLRAPLPVTSEPAPEIITEPAPTPAPAPAPASAAAPAVAKPAASPPPPAAPPKSDDGARARALLDGSAASAPKEGRFVVQVGAYSDAGVLREVRAKVEKLGLKTYTQVVEVDAGKRTRVRVGPFATRDQAEQTAAKVKAAGLPTAILVL